jgi:hypothetical protein
MVLQLFFVYWKYSLLFFFSNEDITKGLYKHMYEQNSDKAKEGENNKINLVCEKIILTLEEFKNTRYFLSILTCHAKKGDLDEALKKIVKYRSKNCMIFFKINI